MVDDDEVMNPQEAGLRRFARGLGYSGDLGLLREALTHSSFANEVGGTTLCNERLEFLGDAVLGLLVSAGLFRLHSGTSEGELSRWRAAIVNERSLSDQAARVGLGALVRLGKGEERTGGRKRASVLANAFEAVLGALFMDGGLGPPGAFIEACFGERIQQGSPDSYRDWKTRLQEAAQRLLGEQPVYQDVEARGPQHAPEFDVVVWLRGQEYGRGTGTSKKRAERSAAEHALAKLEGDALTGNLPPPLEASEADPS